MKRLLSPSSINLPAADSRRVSQIRELADSWRAMSDCQLRECADQLRLEKSRDAAALQKAFALVCQAIRRTLGMQLYDTQILAGLVMARGAIAQMQTGEGKTLAASLPAFWFSLAGGVHIATPNPYLAERDWRLLKPAFDLLGCSCGLLPEGAAAHAKRAAYACDVVYATGYELGFDYLRDRLAQRQHGAYPLGVRHRRLLRGEPVETPCVQSHRRTVIIDEIDSVLIDEACTPLVLAESSSAEADDARACRLARGLALQLAEGNDFLIDRAERAVQFTETGLQLVHACLAQLKPGPLLRPWAEYVRQALYGERLLSRDIDYVLDGGRVLLVDEFTGRIFKDRSWQDGLHQAVEAKEGLPLRAPARTLARVTRQRFFRLYDTICGMTGTADSSRREFHRQYGLLVECIPLAHECRRREWPDRYFVSREAKFRAIVREVQQRHATGQPLLIGSRTIENSMCLAQLLQNAGVPCRLLNGRQDEAEAQIVAQAGQRGAVTIATNMAGRGTDIRLGPGVDALGGLHLLGAERNDSQRVDRQLIGRVARQGDPGSSQFFVSADDPLLVRFALRLVQKMRRMPHRDGEICADLSRQVLRAQRRAEAQAAAARWRLVLYDDWLNGTQP